MRVRRRAEAVANTHWSRWVFLLVPLLGLGELGAHCYFAHRPPSEKEWRAAASELASQHRESELVVVAPQWAEPVARMVLGDSLMPIRDVARPDESRYSSAMEISILGQESQHVLGWREHASVHIGKFVVRHLENPSFQRVLYDFVEHVDEQHASASLHDGHDRSCAWSDSAQVLGGGLGGPPTFPAHRFVCPAPTHVFVGVTVVDDQNYLPRRCIMMHAPDKGFIEARFRDVELGREIRGHSGMRMMIERDLSGTPILLEVLVDGEKVGEDVHVDGQWWKPWRIELGVRAGKRAEVAFRVSSARESQRQMCWEADTR